MALVALSVFAAPCLAHAGSGGIAGAGLGLPIRMRRPVPARVDEWVSYSSHGTTYNMTCASATLSGCSNVQDVNFTYGQLIPSGTVNGVGSVSRWWRRNLPPRLKPTNHDMLQYYFAQGYGVVQVAWNSDWEQTFDANIQNAACRPATFLNYVYNNIYQPLTQGRHGNSSAGM